MESLVEWVVGDHFREIAFMELHYLIGCDSRIDPNTEIGCFVGNLKSRLAHKIRSHEFAPQFEPKCDVNPRDWHGALN